jgi:transcriptional regulator with XRE-family HTH domain
MLEAADAWIWRRGAGDDRRPTVRANRLEVATGFPQSRVKYHGAAVALRVLRLVAVASIFAFVLVARTVMPTHASTDDPVVGPPPADVDQSPTDLGGEPLPPELPPPEPPPIEKEPPRADAVEPPSDTPPADTPPTEPPPTDPPPTDSPGSVAPPSPEPAPVEKESPPDDAAEPAPTARTAPATPTEPPPAETPEAVVPPTDNAIAPQPPADDAEPAPTDPPPAGTPEPVVPPTDSSIAAQSPPEDPVEPAMAYPEGSDPTVAPLPDRATTVADPTDPDRSSAEQAPAVRSTHRSPKPVPPVADDPSKAATEPVSAIVSALARVTHGGPDLPADTEAFHSAVAAGAGLAAGLVVTNQAPSSVAVAIEFGRVGGGWAGALVFNLWLRRQLRERRISQRQLAVLAGVDHSTISRLLRENRRPSLTTATKLAGALRQVRGEQAEPETADYFERNPEGTVFPARRVELALRADELLDEEQVRRLMNIYLDARRRHQAGTSPSAPTRARLARAGPDPPRG